VWACALEMAKVILAVLAAVIALLYQLEADPSYWTAYSSVRLDVVPDEVMRFLTNIDQMEKWFSLVSYVRQADFKPVGVSKQYHAIYNIPWIGEYAILFKVVGHETNSKLHLESENLLKPRIEFNIRQSKPKETYLTIRIQYRRNSVLFQYTLSPLLYFVTNQQLHQSLFTLRMLFPY